MFLYRHPDDFYQLFGSAVILIAGPKKRDEAYYKLVQRSMKRSGHISERTVIRALERFMKDRIFPLCRRHRVAEPDIGGMMQRLMEDTLHTVRDHPDVQRYRDPDGLWIYPLLHSFSEFIETCGCRKMTASFDAFWHLYRESAAARSGEDSLHSSLSRLGLNGTETGRWVLDRAKGKSITGEKAWLAPLEILGMLSLAVQVENEDTGTPPEAGFQRLLRVSYETETLDRPMRQWMRELGNRFAFDDMATLKSHMFLDDPQDTMGWTTTTEDHARRATFNTPSRWVPDFSQATEIGKRMQRNIFGDRPASEQEKRAVSDMSVLYIKMRFLEGLLRHSERLSDALDDYDDPMMPLRDFRLLLRNEDRTHAIVPA